MKLTDAATNLLKQRYCSHGEKPKDVFPRVGKTLAAVMNDDEDASISGLYSVERKGRQGIHRQDVFKGRD